MFLTVPTRVMPFLLSGLISWPGKLRMALDLVMPRGRGGDESIGSFVGRRFGREAVEKIAEPLMAGIFVAPADRLSLRSTFPRFLDLEKEKRSLILALRKMPSGGNPFRTLRGGMSTLVDALRDQLTGAEVLLASPARGVERRRSGWRIEFDGGSVEADHAILACPAPKAAALLREAAPEAASRIASIPYVSTATVTLAYRSPSIQPPEGTGFVLPKGEHRRILACTWSSSKFEGRAPEGDLLVRCFFGGAGREDRALAPEDDLVRVAREELRELMGLADPPAASHVFRWPAANPVYEVGHDARVAELDRILPSHPGLHLTGAGYRGVGIPDCIHDSSRLASRLS